MKSPILTKFLHIVLMYYFPPHFFLLFLGSPAAHRSSRARGWIRAAAAGLYHSYGNTDLSHSCSLCCSMQQRLTLTHWVRPGIKPASSRILSQVLNPVCHNRNSLIYYFLSSTIAFFNLITFNGKKREIYFACYQSIKCRLSYLTQ